MGRIIQCKVQRTVCILKVISLRDRNKFSQMLSWHLAESPGNKVSVRSCLASNGLKGRVEERQTRKNLVHLMPQGMAPGEDFFRRRIFRRSVIYLNLHTNTFLMPVCRGGRDGTWYSCLIVWKHGGGFVVVWAATIDDKWWSAYYYDYPNTIKTYFEWKIQWDTYS